MKTNYKLQGTPNSPVLILSNSLGVEMTMWDELVPHLLPYFRTLQYDTRGHGGSGIPSAPYSIEDLGEDVIDLMDKLKIETAHFCGLSLGGVIGQWLGINHPERFEKLILSNTAAKIGDSTYWNNRIASIKQQGLQTIVNETIGNWFTEDFIRKNPKTIAEIKGMLLSCDITGYTNCCAAIRDADFREKVQNIPVETLIITGDEDIITNVEEAEYLANKIPYAHLKVLHTKHLSGVETPKEYTQTLLDFLVGDSNYARGMHVRRTVLGNAYVDKANEKINSFNTDFQSFITDYVWSEIWTRPNLSKHSRSLITVAMLIALNRKPEFKLHLKAALNNGVSVAEIKEVILQSAIYCGVPAANEAFAAAQELFKEVGVVYENT